MTAGRASYRGKKASAMLTGFCFVINFKTAVITEKAWFLFQYKPLSRLFGTA
jgi:hypothetical protein